MAITLILAISGITLVYIYKDTIIQKFVAEANKHLNSPVHVDKIDITILQSFPTVTIQFKNIKIESSNGSNKPLLDADELLLNLDPISIFNGDYTIEGVSISNAICYMEIDRDGKNNYNIVKKTDNSNSSRVNFQLKTIFLENVEYRYWSAPNKVLIDLFSESTGASLVAKNENFLISAKGDYEVDSIFVNNQEFLRKKNLKVNSSIDYNDKKKHLDISPSSLFVNGSEFITYGSYSYLDERKIDLYLEGKQTNIKTITSLLPSKVSSKLDKYNSEGEAYFDLSLVGELAKNKGPKLEIHFGLDKANIFYPDNDITLNNVVTEGFYSASSIYNLKQSNLELQKISGDLEGKAFNSEVVITSFDDPQLQFYFEGELSMSSLSKFITHKSLVSADGVMSLDVSFKGKVNHLKSKALAEKVKTSGQIALDNLSIDLEELNYPITQLSGQLLFNNNNVALNNISGLYGSSDFNLNGFFKNLLAYILLPDEPIGIEAKLKSNFIDLDEILTQKSDAASASEQYKFSVSPKLRLNFDCDVSKLSFRRFKPTNLKGTLLVKNEVVQSKAISFDGLGGQVTLSGVVDANRKNQITTSTSLELTNVEVDSIFYIFENFNQTFLESRHLEGNVFANVDASMKFDSLLNLYPQSLESTINLTIQNGELNNFDPLKKLRKYVDEDKLDRLRFSDLNTEILIRDQTIYLPQVEVGTNITSLKISGTHTFDQRIDYKVITPLRMKKKLDKDEAFGAIEQSRGGQSLLYLQITGTADDYEVSYDKAEVKKKIVADLKKEVEELKTAFKNKGLKENKTIELEEDDYFDWDEQEEEMN